MLTYVALHHSMGAMPGVPLQPVWRRLGGADLYHSEDTKNDRLLAAQQPRVGQPDFANDGSEGDPPFLEFLKACTPQGSFDARHGF